MSRIKHLVLKITNGKVEPADKKAAYHEDVATAVASVNEPGEYAILPVLIINPKSKKDGKEETTAGVEENNNQGESTSQETPNGEVDESNKTGKQRSKRKKAGAK